MAKFLKLRREYLRQICASICARREPTDKQKHKSRNKSPRLPYLNFADGDNPVSVEFADRLIERLGFPLAEKPPLEQRSGSEFTDLTKQFVESAFGLLAHLRPGEWRVTTSQAAELLAGYDQYAHLSEIAKLCREKPEIAAVLGGDYFVKPDILIGRCPVSDDEINEHSKLVDEDSNVARMAPLRLKNSLRNSATTSSGKKSGMADSAKLILHATISCKWTLRSDRAQNARTEALNLIRNRKGRTPHVVVVTMEPLPNRLASIALGTGDIDCTYHAALYELLEVARESNHADAVEALESLVATRRLRDVSDLPMDLAT